MGVLSLDGCKQVLPFQLSLSLVLCIATLTLTVKRRQARHHSGNHSGIPELPSGKRTKSYWKLPLIVDLPKKNSMVIFHSYVSLPQAKMYQTQFGGIPKAAKPAFRGNLSGAIALWKRCVNYQQRIHWCLIFLWLSKHLDIKLSYRPVFIINKHVFQKDNRFSHGFDHEEHDFPSLSPPNKHSITYIDS